MPESPIWERAYDRKGFLIRQTDKGWVRETPQALNHWSPTSPTVDGQGGIWSVVDNISFDEEGASSHEYSVAHRTPSGVWTVTPKPVGTKSPDPETHVRAVASIGGAIWAVGQWESRWDFDGFFARPAP